MAQITERMVALGSENALYGFEGAEKHIQKGTGNERQTGTRGYSSAGRAPALQAGGHRFESVYLHHTEAYGSGGRADNARMRAHSSVG